MSDGFYRYVIDLFRSGKSEEGAKLVDEEIRKSPNSEESLHLRLMRARALEFGGWGCPIDLGRARMDYIELMPHKEDLGSDVPLGLARVSYKLNHEQYASEVLELLGCIIPSAKNPHAYMLRGMVNEEVMRDGSKARRDYWIAFTLGLPWGMRYLARSYWSRGNYFRGALAHVIATLSTPLLLWRFGPRGVLYENFWAEFHGTERRCSKKGGGSN